MSKVGHSELMSSNLNHRRDLLQTFKLISKQKKTAHLITVKTFNKGEFLVNERQPVHGIFLVLEGKVKVFNAVLNNKIHILRFVSSGNFVGLSSLNTTHYWASAIVMKKVKTYFIDLEHLHYILKNNINLSLLLINELSLKLRHYEVRQNISNLFTAHERVIDAVLHLAYKFGKLSKGGIEISVGTARKDIANYANTSVELTIRSLSDLKSKQYIKIEGKRIIIKEQEVLINQLKQIECKNNQPIDANLCYPYLYY
jgi:CRP-like cAMP-binding protein